VLRPSKESPAKSLHTVMHRPVLFNASQSSHHASWHGRSRAHDRAKLSLLCLYTDGGCIRRPSGSTRSATEGGTSQALRRIRQSAFEVLFLFLRRNDRAEAVCSLQCNNTRLRWIYRLLNFGEVYPTPPKEDCEKG
jgi:hypothetical protein